MNAGEMTGRRVLFIGTPFFGYFRQIIAAFEARGYVVDHYDDRPSDKSVIKGAIKVRPSAMQLVVRHHLDQILKRTGQRQYDLIFVLNGKALTEAFVQTLRDRQPQAQAVLYLWDAIELYPHVLDFAPLFDRRYTFDRRDAMKHPRFELLPLFYSHDYKSLAEQPVTDPTYDLITVCTAHANRYAIMKRMLPELRADGLRVFSYLYLDPLQLAYNRLYEPVFKGARLRDFRTRPMNARAYLELLRQSCAVLDINHSAQTGLTIRTIETLGARKKLITTNQEVEEYAFYDPSRILVIDPADLDVASVREFLEAPMTPLEERKYEALGIDHWVATIIDPESIDE
ncbi:hypothetical protein ACVW00_003426 [Marmoricola sp. URHA0025 HA25]